MTITKEDILLHNLENALAAAAQANRERDHLRRILVQATLAAGGKVQLDPKLADAATQPRPYLRYARTSVRLV